MTHISVLKKEVIKYLQPKPNENFIDCTIGQAGHTTAILEKNKPKGKVLGIDRDPILIKNLDLRKRLILAQGSYTDLEKIVKKHKFKSIQGILFDLGMSTWHLEKSNRGFSFQKDQPLDMRYCTADSELTAEQIVNKWPEKEIEKILNEYGQERLARRIAREIVDTRKIKLIKTTFQLKEIILRAIPKRFQHQRIHFATRTFQALRIAVNNELNNLKIALPQAIKILEPFGRIVVISFHSGEDRIVKNFFKQQAKQNLVKILTKKPIKPTEQEIRTNPNSRSAKLRVAVKI